MRGGSAMIPSFIGRAPTVLPPTSHPTSRRRPYRLTWMPWAKAHPYMRFVFQRIFQRGQEVPNCGRSTAATARHRRHASLGAEWLGATSINAHQRRSGQPSLSLKGCSAFKELQVNAGIPQSGASAWPPGMRPPEIAACQPVPSSRDMAGRAHSPVAPAAGAQQPRPPKPIRYIPYICTTSYIASSSRTAWHNHLIFSYLYLNSCRVLSPRTWRATAAVASAADEQPRWHAQSARIAFHTRRLQSLHATVVTLPLLSAGACGSCQYHFS